MAATLALQCSIIWAMKTHTLGAGQFFEFILTRPWKEWHLKMMWAAEIQILNEDMIVTTALHCARQEEPAILTYRLLLRMRRMYVASIRSFSSPERVVSWSN